MTTASDNFNRTAEVPLAAPWTSVIGGGCNSNGSAAVSTASTDKVSLYSGTWGNDQEAEGIVGALQSNIAYASLGVRMATTGGGRGYVVITDGASGAAHTEIGMWTAGGYSTLTAIATTFANGNTLKIGVVGSTITVYKNGASVGSTTDTTYTTGNPAVGAYGTATIDDWAATDGGAAAGQPTWKRMGGVPWMGGLANRGGIYRAALARLRRWLRCAGGLPAAMMR